MSVPRSNSNESLDSSDSGESTPIADMSDVEGRALFNKDSTKPLGTTDLSILNTKTHRDLVTEFKNQINQSSERPENKRPEDFYFLKVLGEGSFSVVYLAEEVSSRNKYAIKVMSKESVSRENKLPVVLRERDVLATLSALFGGHPFVTCLYCAFQDRTRLFFAMEAAPNGELYDLLRYMEKFSEPLALFYCSEIVEALSFIHKCRVIHRDLKPENILLNHNWHILIADFGSAKLVGNEEQERMESQEATTQTSKYRGSFVGTAQYISPEVLQKKLAGYEADFWAVGAILFQMLTGKAPFHSSNDYHIMKRIMNMEYAFPDNFPAEAKDLIKSLLVVEPQKRLGSIAMGGTEAVKRHPYFASVDWATIKDRQPPCISGMLPEVWAEHHAMEEVNETMKPGLDRLAMNRLMGFGKRQVYEEEEEEDNETPPKVLSPSQLNELKLAKQRTENQFHKFVDNNLIIKSGFIDKKKGLFARRRMFLLTEGPHLYYVDPLSMELRGQVPFSKDMRTEAKNFRSFFIHTPNRTYILFDPERNAAAWCEAIDAVRDRYFNSETTNGQDEAGTASSSSKTQ